MASAPSPANWNLQIKCVTKDLWYKEPCEFWLLENDPETRGCGFRNTHENAHSVVVPPPVSEWFHSGFSPPNCGGDGGGGQVVYTVLCVQVKYGAGMIATQSSGSTIKQLSCFVGIVKVKQFSG